MVFTLTYWDDTSALVLINHFKKQWWLNYSSQARTRTSSFVFTSHTGEKTLVQQSSYRSYRILQVWRQYYCLRNHKLPVYMCSTIQGCWKSNNESHPSVMMAKTSHLTGATCWCSPRVNMRQHAPDPRGGEIARVYNQLAKEKVGQKLPPLFPYKSKNRVIKRAVMHQEMWSVNPEPTVFFYFGIC